MASTAEWYKRLEEVSPRTRGSTDTAVSVEMLTKFLFERMNDSVRLSYVSDEIRMAAAEIAANAISELANYHDEK